jgi:ferric-dicitrate binding protein FerR (iron transport regulator)
MDKKETRAELSLTLLEEYRNTPIDGLRGRVKETIGHRERRRRRLTAVRRGSVAAVAVAVAAVAVAAWHFAGGNFAGGRDTAEAGGRFEQSAVLTLDDGRRIVLRQPAGREIIARPQGATVVHDGDGLSYEPAEGAAAELYSTLSVPKGMTYALTLEDGTRVWLNADSRLRFPSAFGGGRRRVCLEGEAYFDVARDAARPFTVETAGQTLTVLGTQFDISAYPDQAVYTTLVTGSVELEHDGRRTGLVPGQRACLDAGEMSVETVDAGEAALWREGIFPFDDQTLDRIFAQLARWYDIEYVFDDPEAASQVLMGNLPIYDGIDPLLGIIEMSGLVTVERRGRLVRIAMKKA